MRKLAFIALFLSTTVFADGYASPYGEWRGQTQYQAMINTTSDPAAHLVTNLTISIDPQGKVYGTSTENGCKMLGIAAPYVIPTIVMLDVTLTSCNYPGFNRTYRGQFSVNTKAQYSSFSLQAIQIAAGKSSTYNITSTMRR